MFRRIKANEQGSPSSPSVSVSSSLWRSEVEGYKIDSEALTTNDVIVGIMGPTGSGKSSFVEKATGITGIAGHSLESFTNDISIVRLPYPGLSLCLVDTPGFDDTNKSDLEIFKLISDWLMNTYKKRIHLTALLYFHRISDNRMAGTSCKNFRLFEKLCGEDFSNVVLTTTMWDEVDESEGAAREDELKRDYWRPMVERGSYVKRFLYSRQSAFSILAPIFDEVHRRSALLIQKELNDLQLQLKETSAGKTLYLELGELVLRHEDILGRIRRDLKDLTIEPDQLLFLMEDYRSVSVQLRRATEDRLKMKISINDRIYRFLSLARWIRLPSFFLFIQRTRDVKKRRKHLEAAKKEVREVREQAEEEVREVREQAEEEVRELREAWQRYEARREDRARLEAKERDRKEREEREEKERARSERERRYWEEKNRELWNSETRAQEMRETSEVWARQDKALWVARANDLEMSTAMWEARSCQSSSRSNH